MGYTDKFVMNHDGISEIGTYNESIKELLKSSFDASKSFYIGMTNTDLWIGESKEEFMAFYHLILQYHGWVSGQTVPSFGKLSPSVQADANCSEQLCAAFKKLYEDMSSFDSNSVSYQGMEEIS